MGYIFGTRKPDRIVGAISRWNLDPIFRPFFDTVKNADMPFLTRIGLAEEDVQVGFRAPPRPLQPDFRSTAGMTGTPGRPVCRIPMAYQ
jgi:hypothetical protein